MLKDDDSDDEVFNYETLYRELGYYITKIEQFDRALPFFDRSLLRSSNDKRALVGRSIARAKAVRYEGALEDINKALELDPEHLSTLAHKALYTYLICNFEDGLVQNLRHLPKRRKPDNFAMGVMHCNQAIENCIGARAGRPLRDHFKIIRHLAWKKTFQIEDVYRTQKELQMKKRKKRQKMRNAKKGAQRKKTIEAVAPLYQTKKESTSDESKHVQSPSGTTLKGKDIEIRDSLHSHLEEDQYIPPYSKPYPFKPLQNFTSNIENFMAEKYLEGMYLDKIFLKTIKENPGVRSPNEVGYKKILQLAREGHKTLSYKQELLRTRRPFYFLKFQETKLSDNLKIKLAKDLQKIQESTTVDANNLLQRIDQAIKDKKTRTALQLSEKLKQMCDLKPKKYMPNKNDYLRQLYKLVGKAYLDIKRINKYMPIMYQEKRIHHMLGCNLDKEPSNDSVLKEFKNQFIDWKKEIAIAENRLRISTDRQEMAWLYHDLSRYHTELKQYELAKIYARKCIVEGTKCDEYAWVVNGLLLVTRINLALHNRNDAKTEIAEAINIATEANDEQLLEYLERTMTVVEKLDFSEMFGVNVLEKRENKIIEIMAESGMKEEIAHLFRQMACMPPSRRMSVMPGIRFTDDQGKKMEDKQQKGRRQSILTTRQPSDEDIVRRRSGGPNQPDVMSLIQFLE